MTKGGKSCDEITSIDTINVQHTLSLYLTAEPAIHYMIREVGDKNPKNSTNIIFLLPLFYSILLTEHEEIWIKKKPAGEKVRYTIKPFSVTI